MVCHFRISSQSTHPRCTGIITSPGSDSDKYGRMTRIVDGAVVETSLKCAVALDNFAEHRNRLQALRTRLALLAQFSPRSCKLCSLLKGRATMHSAGCPAIFNHCFKCIGVHAGKTCTERYFKLPKGVCWCCWLPLHSTFGFAFHKQEIASQCSNPAKDLLKAFTILFFHNRHVAPGVSCVSTTKEEYATWLFHTSSAGEGQLPNIFLLLEAALVQVESL